jgi:hypothetical protein
MTVEVINILEEHAVSVFRVKHLAKQQLHYACLAKCSSMKIGEVCSSKKQVNLYQTAQHHIPDDSTV